MSESYPHLTDGAIRDFQQIMMDRGYWEYNRWTKHPPVYTFPTGSIIKFISIDKLGKAHGPRRDVLFINEANNIDFHIYEQLEVRTKEHIWLDWNPTNEFWYYTEIKDRIDHDFITLTYLDCKDVLDNRIIESIESRKDNKMWWQVYGLGQLGEIEGRIYTNWQIIDDIPHEARLWRRGLDFGYSIDPSVLVAIYEYNGGYIIDEEIYNTGLSNKNIADTIQNLPEPKSLVIADSAEPKSIDEINGYGINILACKKGAGSVLQGIQYVQDQKISITKRSVKTIKAYRNYLWKQDKNTNKSILVPDDSIHEWSNSCLVGNTNILLKDGTNKKIKDIKIGDYVKTEKGSQKVIDKQLTQRQAEVYEIVLSNGYSLIGTKDHRIYTNNGKVAIDGLSNDDIIKVLINNKIPIWKKSLRIMEKDIIRMLNIIQDIFHDKTEKDQANYYIDKYGKTLMEKYQKDITFITRMNAQQITELITLSLLKLVNTYQNIQKRCGYVKDLKKRCKSISGILENLRKNGTLLMREESGTVNTAKTRGKTRKHIRNIVKFVEKNMKHIFRNEVDFAITIVKRKHYGKKDVYNLTVEKEHNYYANGILVANCDAIRYAFNGEQKSKTKVQAPPDNYEPISEYGI